MGINLKEAISMGLGAMIGGGIFAVLGIAIGLAGRAVVLSYLIAGVIALAAGYSYAKLTLHVCEEGGSFTFLEHFMDDHRPAAFVGWTLILGYIGTVSMYAYTFGAFSAELLVDFLPLDHTSLRIIVSLLILVIFLFINLQGVESSAESEFWMVSFKILILLLVGIIGLIAVITGDGIIASETGNLFSVGLYTPFLAVSVIFVSFEGFQLLTYEFNQMEDRENVIMKGMIISIAISTFIYILISFVTSTLLSPTLIQKKGETILAYVLFSVFTSPIIQQISFIVIINAALLSTGSAINATLFGTAMLSSKIAENEDLPEVFSFRDKSQQVPVRSLLIITGTTILLTAFGNLEQIVSFASLSFLIIFFVVSWVLIKQDIECYSSIVYISLIGTATVIIMHIIDLILHNLKGLIFTVGIYLGIFALVLLFFRQKEELDAV